MDQETLTKVFEIYDKDKSGKLDAKELKNVLKDYYEEMHEPIDDAKLDNDVGVRSKFLLRL